MTSLFQNSQDHCETQHFKDNDILHGPLKEKKSPLREYFEAHTEDALLWLIKDLIVQEQNKEIDFDDLGEAAAPLIASVQNPISRDQYLHGAQKLDKRLKKPLIAKRVKEILEEVERKSVTPGAGIAIPKEAFIENDEYTYDPEKYFEDYGFFAQGNRYYKWQAFPNGGGEWRDFTNFTMRVLYHMDNGIIIISFHKTKSGSDQFEMTFTPLFQKLFRQR